MSPGQPGTSPASQQAPEPGPRAAANSAAVVVPLRRPGPEPEHEPQAASRQQPVPPARPVPASPPPQGLAHGDWWAQLLERLQLDGLLANLARHAMLLERHEDEWQLLLDPGHQPMATDARVGELADAISAYLDRRVRLKVQFRSGGEDSPAQRDERARQARLDHAREVLREDQVIQALVNEFNGRLDEDSIEPE